VDRTANWCAGGVLLLVHCGREVVVSGTSQRTDVHVGSGLRRVDGLRRSTCSLRSPKKKKPKFRVFDGLFFTLLEKGGFVLLERTRSSRQQERRSACACLRAWKCVLCSCSSSCNRFSTWVFVVECVFSSASSVEQGFWLCFVEGFVFFFLWPFGLG
jgi:hypothetical protein